MVCEYTRCHERVQLLLSVPQLKLVNWQCSVVAITLVHSQAWTPQQLQQDLGFASEPAQQLSDWSHGRDHAPVAERPPPKTLSIQMTLTPIPLVMHPSMGRDIAVAGGKAGAHNVIKAKAILILS